MGNTIVPKDAAYVLRDEQCSGITTKERKTEPAHSATSRTAILVRISETGQQLLSCLYAQRKPDGSITCRAGAGRGRPCFQNTSIQPEANKPAKTTEKK